MLSCRCLAVLEYGAGYVLVQQERECNSVHDALIRYSYYLGHYYTVVYSSQYLQICTVPCTIILLDSKLHSLAHSLARLLSLLSLLSLWTPRSQPRMSTDHSKAPRGISARTEVGIIGDPLSGDVLEMCWWRDIPYSPRDSGQAQTEPAAVRFTLLSHMFCHSTVPDQGVGC